MQHKDHFVAQVRSLLQRLCDVRFPGFTWCERSADGGERAGLALVGIGRVRYRARLSLSFR
jgi:hypothetical protein